MVQIRSRASGGVLLTSVFITYPGIGWNLCCVTLARLLFDLQRQLALAKLAIREVSCDLSLQGLEQRRCTLLCFSGSLEFGVRVRVRVSDRVGAWAGVTIRVRVKNVGFRAVAVAVAVAEAGVVAGAGASVGPVLPLRQPLQSRHRSAVPGLASWSPNPPS